MSEQGNDVVLKDMHQTSLFPHQIERNDEMLTLREVDQDSVHFNNLVKSIKTPRKDDTGRVVTEHGLLNPIVVRPLPGQRGKFAIVDGLHRLTAWKVAFGDAKPIPAHIVDLSEIQVVKAQVQGNALTKKTEKAEFAKAILKYMDAFPELSIEQVADEVSVDPNTLKTWLTLTKLPDYIQEAVNKESVPASVAYILARFTEGGIAKNPEAQAFWDAAQKEWFEHYLNIAEEDGSLNRWMGEASNALKKLKADRREGKKHEGSTLNAAEPTPTLRKKGEIEIEAKRAREALDQVGVTDDELKAFAEKGDNKKFITAAFSKGYTAFGEWVVQMDPETYNRRKEEKQAMLDKRQQAAEEKKAGKKTESVARATGLFALFGPGGKKKD